MTRRRIWGISLIVLVTLVALCAYDALALRNDLKHAQAEVDATLALSEPLRHGSTAGIDIKQTLRATTAHVKAADSALSAADLHARLIAPLLALGALVPGWPRGLSEVRPTITMAHNLTAGTVALSQSLNRIVAQLGDKQAGQSSGARLADGLTKEEPNLHRAADALNQARAQRASINAARLTGPLAPAAHALATFDAHADELNQAAAMLVELPPVVRSLLGMDGPRTYLVLGQNSDELRPTGGFIGSMGTVTLQNGALVAEDYRSSYSFDNPQRPWGVAPPEYRAHTAPDYLTPDNPDSFAVRNANWSPDFPTSARTIEQFLLNQHDITVDGVIGLTTYSVSDLIDALGPLQVDGYDQPVTAQTWNDTVVRMIYFDDPTVPTSAAEMDARNSANKKAVLEPMLRALVRSVQDIPLDRLPLVARALQRSLDQRQLLLYFHDPVAASLIQKYDADGRLTPPAHGDSLAIIDANLTGAKAGPYISQSIAYEVWLDEHGVAQKSQLTVRDENHVTPEQAQDVTKRLTGFDWHPDTGEYPRVPGLYGTYARAYVPQGSQLLSVDPAQPDVTKTDELGFSCFGQYYRVPLSSSLSYTYTYSIPRNANVPGEYSLHMVKQPGVPGPSVEVRVHLPEQTSATENLPMLRDAGSLVYRGTLSSNLDLRITLSSTATAQR